MVVRPLPAVQVSMRIVRPDPMHRPGYLIQSLEQLLNRITVSDNLRLVRQVGDVADEVNKLPATGLFAAAWYERYVD